jgi:hypothetical protein
MASNQLSGEQNVQVVESTAVQIKSEESGDRPYGNYPTSNITASTSPRSPIKSARSNPNPPIQSCQLCRRRKIRCDKSTPSCTQCLKANTECVYPTRKSRSSASALKNSAGAQSREEQLLKRISKLESAIQGLKVRSVHVATPEGVSTSIYDIQDCET